MSRAPIDQVYGDQDYKKSINMLTKSEVREYQAKFSESERKNCEEIEGILVKRNDERIRVVVSGEEMERELIKRIHTEHCHRGVATMLSVTRRAWAVKELRKKLQEYRKQCETCVKNRLLLKQNFGVLSKLGPVREPFDVVSIDTKGGFSGYNSTKKYLHLAIDHATRFVWSVAAKGQGENDLSALMREVFKDGSPKIVLSDRYGAMRGNKFRRVIEENGGKLVYTCADSPSSNGMIERVGFTISEAIRCELYDRNYEGAWTSAAKQAVGVYNDTHHSITGYTPRYLLKGERRETALFPSKETETLEEAREKANERSEKNHAKNAFYYNQNRKDVRLEVGQQVYCKLASQLNRGHYETRYEGLFEVKRIVSGTRFEIEKDGKMIVSNKKNLRLRIPRLEVD